MTNEDTNTETSAAVAPSLPTWTPSALSGPEKLNVMGVLRHAIRSGMTDNEALDEAYRIFPANDPKHGGRTKINNARWSRNDARKKGVTLYDDAIALPGKHMPTQSELIAARELIEGDPFQVARAASIEKAAAAEAAKAAKAEQDAKLKAEQIEAAKAKADAAAIAAKAKNDAAVSNKAKPVVVLI